MTFSLGRFGLQHTGVGVTSWSVDGNVVRAAGWMRDATLLDLKGLREQGLGLVNNPDEPEVPCVWSDDTSQTGFYQVLDFSCEYDLASTLTLRDGYYWLDWTATLRRVAGYVAPDVEEVLAGGLRSNSHSITTTETRPALGIVSTAKGFYPNVAATEEYLVDTADGGDIFHLDHGTGGSRNTFFDARARYYLAPADWYKASCSLQVGGQTQVGRNIANDPTEWTLSNELVKVRPGASGALEVYWWDGTSWDMISFQAAVGGTAWTDTPYAITALRVSPACTVIRLHIDYQVGGEPNQRRMIDLAVRRGMRWVEGYINVPGRSSTYGIQRTATEASTAITGGIRATSNDANGNRFVLAAPAALTTDLVNGQIRRSSSDESFSFMIGCAVGGSGASDPHTEQILTYGYFSQVGVRQRVVLP